MFNMLTGAEKVNMCHKRFQKILLTFNFQLLLFFKVYFKLLNIKYKILINNISDLQKYLQS